jgi:hypothetical protein
MHDSTHSVRKVNAAGEEVNAEEGSEQGGGGAFSWEVRLVQEFCDLGSLRDALKGGKQFR